MEWVTPPDQIPKSEQNMKQTKLIFPEKLPTAASEKPNPTSKILIATTGQIPTINLEDLSTEELLKQ